MGLYPAATNKQKKKARWHKWGRIFKGTSANFFDYLENIYLC